MSRLASTLLHFSFHHFYILSQKQPIQLLMIMIFSFISLSGRLRLLLDERFGRRADALYERAEVIIFLSSFAGLLAQPAATRSLPLYAAGTYSASHYFWHNIFGQRRWPPMAWIYALGDRLLFGIGAFRDWPIIALFAMIRASLDSARYIIDRRYSQPLSIKTSFSFFSPNILSPSRELFTPIIDFDLSLPIAII